MGGLGKLIAAKGFKKWPKVQKIAQSGHTVPNMEFQKILYLELCGKIFVFFLASARRVGCVTIVSRKSKKLNAANVLK